MITIQPNELKALALFAATDKDTRTQIRGVHVEQRKDRTILVATNGYSIGALCLDVVSDREDDYLIPNAALKAVNLKGGSVEIHWHEGHVTITQGVTSSTHKLTDLDPYMDWRRAIPSKVSGEAGHFDALLVGEVGKAYALMTGLKWTPGIICHNGTGAALLDFERDDFTGVLMPIRIAPTRNAAPGWAS